MEPAHPVELYVYDLSGGMARAMSMMLLGKQIDAVYHTSIVVHQRELYYGQGINQARPLTTPFGHPMEVVRLGETELDEELLDSLLLDLAQRYTAAAYSLFTHNCNTFSDELARVLVGCGIPAHITSLPAEVLATPFGAMIAPMLSGLEAQLGGMQRQELPGVAVAEPATAAAPARAAAPAPAPAPAVAAAEHELDAAIADGMIREASSAAAELRLAAGQRAPAGAPPRVAAELAVRAEFDSIMAEGRVSEHDAEALALERVAARGELGERAAAAESAAAVAGVGGWPEATGGEQPQAEAAQ